MYCFFDGQQLEAVDTGRFERENKPNVYRCSRCGVGFEVAVFNGCAFVSEAPTYNKPELSIVECELSPVS